MAVLIEGGILGPFDSKKFKTEKNRWYKRLKKEGFDDIENSGNEFRAHRRQFQDKSKHERALDFFLHLDWLLTFYEEMPSFERRVMELYSDGLYIRDIVKKVKASDKHVRNVIKRYKHLVRTIIRMLTSADNPLSLRLVSNSISEDTANADVRIQDKAA